MISNPIGHRPIHGGLTYTPEPDLLRVLSGVLIEWEHVSDDTLFAIVVGHAISGQITPSFEASLIVARRAVEGRI